MRSCSEEERNGGAAREDGAAAAVRSTGADTRPRREGKGVMGCSGVLAKEGGREGKERGGVAVTGHPL
jgi:hypothetical protein